MRRGRFRYSVSEAEANIFVKDNNCVREFLNMYDLGGITFSEKSVGLARFFRWLKIIKGIEMSPVDFLNTHLRKTKAENVEERRWALRLALEYSRDNPDLKGKAASYKYSAWFLPVKTFCDYNEAPLTTRKGFFPKRGRRKYSGKPFVADFIKRALGLLNQRERAVCMVQLQSGQSIQQVLDDISMQCKRIYREIDQGKERIRFDFPERKGNGFKYFSFISRDAIQEIQKWRPLREQIIRKIGKETDYLFITETGRKLSRKQFHNIVRLAWRKLRNGPYQVSSHGFRKFFEQEASPPERGISKSYVTYMMGHSSGKDSNGIQINHPLDVVGGVYDTAPRVYPDVVENEYAKLEPYINIYSGRMTDKRTDMSQSELASAQLLGEQIAKISESVKRWQDDKGILEAKIAGFENFQKLVLDQPDDVVLEFIKDVRRQLEEQGS